MLQQLNETLVTRGKITESDRTKLPKGVLCRVSYNICNLGKLNQNNRIYSREVWENVLKNKSIQDKIQNRVLFGHAEHPSTSQSDLQLTSHVITKMWIDEAAGCVMQEMDVLDTPTGRIVNTLLEAGCAAGVSTRAEGDLEEAVDEATGQKYLKVIPEKYNYLTTDFTADPSTYGTKPLNLVREIKNVLSSASLTKGEKAFATTLLEAIEKVDKGTKESIVPDDEDSEEKKIEKLTEGTIEQFIEAELIKAGVLAKCMGMSGKIKEIKEHTVTIAFDNGAEATITGPMPVSVGPEGMVLIPNIAPVEQPLQAAVEPLNELPDTTPSDLPITPETEGGESDVLTPEEEEEAIDRGEELKAALEDDVITDEEHEAMETPEEEEAEHAPGGYEEGEEEEEGEVPTEDEEEEKEEVEESKDTKALYTKKGLTPPQGKGIHKKKFHEMATAIAAKMKKEGKSEKEAKKSGYAISMSKLGKKGAVKAGHRSNEAKFVFESYEDMVDYLKNEFTKLSPEQTAKLSSIFPTAALNESKGNTTNEVRTLKLKEAATRAESEKALEMLTEAEKEIETIRQSVMIESKVLSSKLQEAKTTESKEVEGLRKLLEEKTKALNEFKSKVNEQTIKLTEAKTTYDSKVKELEEKFQSKIIKEYIDMKANGASLRLPSNSRALLEKCSSIKEVDKVFEDVRDALRRGALLPDGVNGIKVQLTEKAKDPVQVQIDASIGAAMSGM